MEVELVCKFVMKGGEDFGESVDVHNDQLIVKVGSDFFGVSVNNIEKVESDKIYISDFDEKKAAKEGKKWIDEKSKPVSLEELKMFGFEEPGESESESESEDGSLDMGEDEDVSEHAKEDAGVDETPAGSESEEQKQGQKPEDTDSQSEQKK